jgi:hypothetical protein
MSNSLKTKPLFTELNPPHGGMVRLRAALVQNSRPKALPWLPTVAAIACTGICIIGFWMSRSNFERELRAQLDGVATQDATSFRLSAGAAQMSLNSPSVRIYWVQTIKQQEKSEDAELQ